MKLEHELVPAVGAPATKTVLFLHGILGSGNNLRSLARKFLEQRPGWQAALVDLRAHGQSLGVEGADTVMNAAADCAQTFRTLDAPVRAVVGHSFGGKVALALAQQHGAVLEQVLTLDSTPGVRLDARGSESTLRVVELLDGLTGPWSKRDDFVDEVCAHGQSRGLAQWLAMNLDKRDQGFVFRLDLRRIHALLEDYFAVDLWPVVERAAEGTGPRIHLVIATKSQVYSHEERVRASALEAKRPDAVTVDLVDAGHWLHVENPQAVLETVLRRLP